MGGFVGGSDVEELGVLLNDYGEIGGDRLL